MSTVAEGPETPKNKYFTPEEDKQIWQYMLDHEGDKELNLKFWDDFKTNTGSVRSAKGLYTRFRNILSQKLHLTDFDDEAKMELYRKYRILIDKEFIARMEQTMDIVVDDHGHVVDYALINQNNDMIHSSMVNGTQNTSNNAKKRGYIESSGPLLPPPPKLLKHEPKERDEEEEDLVLGHHHGFEREAVNYSELLDDEEHENLDNQEEHGDEGENGELIKTEKVAVESHYKSVAPVTSKMAHTEQKQKADAPLLVEHVSSEGFENLGPASDPSVYVAQEQQAVPMAPLDITHFFDSLKDMVVDATKQTMREIASDLLKEKEQQQAEVLQDSRINLHYFLSGLKVVVDNINSPNLAKIQERINNALRTRTNETVPMDSIRSLLDVTLKLFQY